MEIGGKKIMKTAPFLYVTPAHRDSIGTILWDRHQGRSTSQLSARYNMLTYEKESIHE